MPTYEVTNPVRKELVNTAIRIEKTRELPQYVVTAVQLPTGATEIAINHDFLDEKIRYILGAYNEDMQLTTNCRIKMSNVMIVWREPYEESKCEQ